MQHLLVVVNLVAFISGILAAALAFQTYSESRLGYLRHFFHYLLLLNIMVGIYLTAAYMVANVDLTHDGDLVDNLSKIFRVLGIAVMAAWLYKLIAVMRGIRDRNVDTRFRSVWIVAFAALLGGDVTARLLAPDPSVREIVMRLEYLLFLLMMLTATIMALHALIACGSLADERRRKAARTFSGIHLVMFLLAPGAVALPVPAALYAVSCGLAAASLVPTLYLRFSVLGTARSALLQPDSAELMASFVGRYGISRREREIVSLVLAGKTNSEIGDILFISANTVRNHIYNVYQKAEVRNRVELINLILKQS